MFENIPRQKRSSCNRTICPLKMARGDKEQYSKPKAQTKQKQSKNGPVIKLEEGSGTMDE